MLRDNWTIIKDFDGKVYGDCEDYSLTLVWLISGQNKTAFWQLLKSKYSLYFVKVGGVGHIVLLDRASGKYIDNIQKKLVDKSVLKSRGYRFKFRVPILFIKLKLIL